MAQKEKRFQFFKGDFLETPSISVEALYSSRGGSIFNRMGEGLGRRGA